jgi:hypothetical protein
MNRTALLLVALAAGLTGCFSVDGTLQADGSARFRLQYYLERHATFRDETRRLTSEHVKLDSVRGIGSRQAIAEIRVDDVTKLSSAEAFRNIEVTRAREGDAESLRLVIRSLYDAAAREDYAGRARAHPEVEGPRITLALPGPVLEANRDAHVEGARVTWHVPLVEYARADHVELRVRWAAPGR